MLVIAYIVSGLVEFLYYFYRGLDRSDLESSLTLGHRLALLVSAMAVLAWRPDLDWLAAAMLLPAAGRSSSASPLRSGCARRTPRASST